MGRLRLDLVLELIVWFYLAVAALASRWQNVTPVAIKGSAAPAHTQLELAIVVGPQ